MEEPEGTDEEGKFSHGRETFFGFLAFRFKNQKGLSNVCPGLLHRSHHVAAVCILVQQHTYAALTLAGARSLRGPFPGSLTNVQLPFGKSAGNFVCFGRPTNFTEKKI